MKSVYRTNDPAEADFLCMALRDAEIVPVLEDTEGAIATPAMPCIIYVHEPDVERARTVIQEALAARLRARRKPENP